MSLNEINWVAEAHKFCKKLGIESSYYHKVVEDAMKEGAGLAIEATTERIKEAREELARRHIASKPHSNETKTIQLDPP